LGVLATPENAHRHLMQSRERLINFAITLALISVVALLALALKGDPKAIPTVQVQTATVVTPQHAHAKQDKLQVYANPQLIPSPSNEPDTFRIRLGEEELFFTLYFVDALDTPASKASRAKEQARYYGTTEGIIHEVGLEAHSYVMDLLQKHPMQLYTRWERRSNTENYYAILMIELKKGRWVYLADLLVHMGYATISGAVTDLPDSDKRSREKYIQELTENSRYAKSKKLGIWAKVKK
jgi:endonuclease YncB( thermonuclease family)